MTRSLSFEDDWHRTLEQCRTRSDEVFAVALCNGLQPFAVISMIQSTIRPLLMIFRRDIYNSKHDYSTFGEYLSSAEPRLCIVLCVQPFCMQSLSPLPSYRVTGGMDRGVINCIYIGQYSPHARVLLDRSRLRPRLIVHRQRQGWFVMSAKASGPGRATRMVWLSRRKAEIVAIRTRRGAHQLRPFLCFLRPLLCPVGLAREHLKGGMMMDDGDSRPPFLIWPASANA
ncbi:hypothetical protein OBBRIDRAFT_199746 [Obba rivulosa]|uniref:Uncharacterized protein n=1 Tax=Obba rivulosa TaxID=1052685 RepID=A0A8E2ARW7_9APHY|nr:hypothetical protein OBBRIDRAFT_199746 [Obba rivulosa]